MPVSFVWTRNLRFQNPQLRKVLYLEDSVKKWVFFFYVLDANKDGVLEHADIDEILDRLLNTKPGLFNDLESNYLKFITHKSFDRLVMEATSGKNRRITIHDWVSVIQKSNQSGTKSYFLRWFSAAAVRFLFDLCDHNKDGYIDFDEFETLYKILGLPRSNIIFAFKAMDENRDGRLSKPEMYNAISDFFYARNESDANYIFGQFKHLSNEYLTKILTV